MTEEKIREEEMLLRAGSIPKQRDNQNHMANVLGGGGDTDFRSVNRGFSFSLLRQMLLVARVSNQGQTLFLKIIIFY